MTDDLEARLAQESAAANHWFEEANREHNRVIKLANALDKLLEWIAVDTKDRYNSLTMPDVVVEAAMLMDQMFPEDVIT